MKILLAWLLAVVVCCFFWFGLVRVVFGDEIDDLVSLVIMAESSGDPNASDGKSFGLMGISECVLQDYIKGMECGLYIQDFSTGIWYDIDGKNPHSPPLTKEQLYCRNINVTIGTWYLRKIQSWLPEEYKHDKRRIVLAYNWGIGNLKKNNYQIPRWAMNHPNKIYRKIMRGEL